MSTQIKGKVATIFRARLFNISQDAIGGGCQLGMPRIGASRVGNRRSPHRRPAIAPRLHLLKRSGGAQQGRVGKAAADDLQANR
jgi:hypothetical protein